MEDILIIIQRGGIVIYPLLVLSIISWAIVLERAYALRLSRFLPKGYAQIKALILGRNIDAATKIAEDYLTKARTDIVKSRYLYALAVYKLIEVVAYEQK